jgi:fucokinase
MGRLYPFDMVGRAFNTLPFEDAKTNTYLTNFDLLFDFITRKIAQYSDPGFYICSSDMILEIPNNGQSVLLILLL